MGTKLSSTFLLSILFIAGIIRANGQDAGGKLKMYVDELPEIPKIHGYKFHRGIPVAKKLTIGMYHKKWVCIYIW